MTNDRTFTADEVRQMLREACEKAGGAINWARDKRLDASLVINTLAERRWPGPTVSAALGLIENERSWRLDNRESAA
jgi:hypothetical protein